MPNHQMYERHLAELRAELDGCETEARKLRALIAAYESLSSSQQGAPAPAPVAPKPAVELDRSVDLPATTARSGERRQLVSSARFRSVTREIMRTVGRPMLRDEIKDRLAERGIVFGGAEPVNAVSTQLYRARDEFQRIPGQGYWFANEPVLETNLPEPPSGSDSGDEEIQEEEAAKANPPFLVGLAAASPPL